MLNLKKGLALVLAAATAFTFAPVTGLNAFAGTITAKYLNNGEVTEGHTVEYTYTGVDSDDKFDNVIIKSQTTATSSQAVAVATNSAAQTITITGAVPSTTPVVLSVRKGTTELGTINLKVNAKSDIPNMLVSGSSVGALDSNNRTVYVADDQTGSQITLQSEAKNSGSATTPTNFSIEGGNTADNAVTTGGVFTALKAGTSFVLEFTDTQQTNSRQTDGKYRVTVKVISHESVLTVEDKKIPADKSVGTVVKTVEASQAKNTYNIAATLDNKQSGENLSYAVLKNLSYSGATNTVETITAGTITAKEAPEDEVTVSDKGVVTVKAKAFISGDKYFVLVSDHKKDENPVNYAVVAIIPSATAKTFTTVSVDVDGTTKTATAKYNPEGAIETGTENADLFLSTKDKTSVSLAPNPATATITSSDPSVVEVSGTTLKAKKAGRATVTVKADSTATTFGIAQILLNVTVSDKYANNPITASDVVLTNNASKATISAKAAYENKLVYEFVKQDSKGNWIADNTQNNLTLDKNTGVVEYKKNGTTGEAHVRITGTANDKAEAPIAKVISVKYQPEKEDSNLTVSTPALNLKAGETGDIKAAATGASISYVSYAPEVATVDAATGKVTAVSKGTAVVAVNAAETDTMKAGQKLVYVTVDNGTIAAPAKVAGLKVTNAKGAKVKVTWTSQGKNIQYRVYKKVGNGKWVAKNVTKGKATLSVKKGAKVQVKVKAFVKDQNGKTVWGQKATKKTFKTDNK